MINNKWVAIPGTPPILPGACPTPPERPIKKDQSYSCLLRTLTRQSVLGFGYDDNKDLTIQTLIDTSRYKKLLEIYYHLGKISFTEDILLELGLTQDLRIKKPNKISYKESGILISKCLRNIYESKDNIIEWSRANSFKRKTINRNRISSEKIDSKIFKKSTMMARNHNILKS